MAKGSGIMPLHSPSGNTLQWSTGRGLLCSASHTIIVNLETKVTLSHRTAEGAVHCMYRKWRQMSCHYIHPAVERRARFVVLSITYYHCTLGD